MRVSVLSNSRGGVFTFTRELATRLVDRGFGVDVYFLGRSANTLPEVPGRLVVSYLMGGGCDLAGGLLNAVGGGYDVLHLNFASFGPVALFAKLAHGTPYVLTLHGLPDPSLQRGLGSKLAYAFESLMIPLVAGHASATISVSEYVRRELKAKYGVESTVIHHGYAGPPRPTVGADEAKRLLEYAPGRQLLLYVGNLSPYKDPLTLVRAVARLPELGRPDVLMVGSGELRDEVVAEARSLGVEANISIRESLSAEKLSLCYRAADAFVLPTLNEAFGIVLLEAMAAGVPVIASRSGACVEVLGEAGLFFSPGDAQGLADQIARLQADPGLAGMMRCAGPARVECFDADEKVDDYVRVFEEAARGRSAR